MKILLLLAILGANILSGCATGVPKPTVKCPFRPQSQSSAICAKAVKVDLGPVDQVVGYPPIKDLKMLLVSEKKAEMFLTKSGEFQNRRQKTEYLISQFSDDPLVIKAVSDDKGDIFLEVPPGRYLLCAIDKSFAPSASYVSATEFVTFKKGSITKVLITHLEWGDNISLQWQK